MEKVDEKTQKQWFENRRHGDNSKIAKKLKCSPATISLAIMNGRAEKRIINGINKYYKL